MKMKLRASHIAFLLLGATAALADRAADDAAWEALCIKQERPLSLETALVGNGAATAAIVPAEGETWTTAAAKLQAAILAKTGVTLPIVATARITDADWAARNLIVIGNLLNNSVFARLYHNYFACADAAYTGAGGYELRTIHDPWGTGHNAIALGAQDAAGVEAGVARFIALINERATTGELKLGRLLELKFTKESRRAPLEQKLTAKEVADRKQAIANIYARPGTERGAAHQTVQPLQLPVGPELDLVAPVAQLRGVPRPGGLPAQHGLRGVQRLLRLGRGQGEFARHGLAVRVVPLKPLQRGWHPLQQTVQGQADASRAVVFGRGGWRR